MNLYQHIKNRDKKSILALFQRNQDGIFWDYYNARKGPEFFDLLSIDDWHFLEKEVLNEIADENYAYGSFDFTKHDFYYDIWRMVYCNQKLSNNIFNSWLDNIDYPMFWSSFAQSSFISQYPQLWAGLNDAHKEKMLRIFIGLTEVTISQSKYEDSILRSIKNLSNDYYYEHILAHILSCKGKNQEYVIDFYARELNFDDSYGSSYCSSDDEDILDENYDDYDDDLNEEDFTESKTYQLDVWHEEQDDAPVFKSLTAVFCDYILLTYNHDESNVRPGSWYENQFKERLATIAKDLDPQFKNEWLMLRDMYGKNITLGDWFNIRFNKSNHVEQEIPLLIS